MTSPSLASCAAWLGTLSERDGPTCKRRPLGWSGFIIGRTRAPVGGWAPPLGALNGAAAAAAAVFGSAMGAGRARSGGSRAGEAQRLDVARLDRHGDDLAVAELDHHIGKGGRGGQHEGGCREQGGTAEMHEDRPAKNVSKPMYHRPLLVS